MCVYKEIYFGCISCRDYTYICMYNCVTYHIDMEYILFESMQYIWTQINYTDRYRNDLLLKRKNAICQAKCSTLLNAYHSHKNPMRWALFIICIL